MAVWAGRQPVWAWCEIARWLAGYEHGGRIDEAAAVTADALAALNATLHYRRGRTRLAASEDASALQELAMRPLRSPAASRR